jgi:hypothetical protein
MNSRKSFISLLLSRVGTGNAVILSHRQNPDKAWLAFVLHGENARVADVPDLLVLKRHRDLEGLRRIPWPRWTVVGGIALLSVLGLLNVFGQHPVTSVARSPAASLKLYAPSHLRGGLLFSARFHVDAHRDLRDAVLILDPGWAEGMSINTIEPSPLGESSSDGRLTLRLGHIAKGSSFVLFLEAQVNPTNVAWHRPAGVTLADGSTPLLHVSRRLDIYP